MARLLSTALLLGCLCLLPAGTARAGDGPFALQCVADDPFLQVHADHPVSMARCKAIAARALKAYAFISGKAAWANPGILRAKPLEFRLLGGELKILGYAKGPNLMVMKDSYLDEPLSEGTLAHELTHIQDLRQLQGRRLPSFLLEGRALTIGNAYRMSIGQPPNGYDRQMAGSAVRFTAAQAEELLNEYRGQGWNNQAIGTVLVEYMRTKWNGKGVPDIQARLSRMIERMAAGNEFEAAFQQEFGTTALALGEAFAKHLNDTMDDPRARLQHTMWQTTAPSTPAEFPDYVAQWLED